MNDSPPVWMQEAAKAARNALCLKSKCGAVVVKNGVVIGSGYNAPPLDKIEYRVCREDFSKYGKAKYDITCCMHAEWRAIMDGLVHNPDKLKGADLYFVRVDDEGDIKKSGQPYCTHCSRMALDTGIARFALWHEEGIVLYETGEYNKLSYQYMNPSQK